MKYNYTYLQNIQGLYRSEFCKADYTVLVYNAHNDSLLTRGHGYGVTGVATSYRLDVSELNPGGG